MDDFIGLVSPNNLDDLQHASRTILHSIHSIFPPAAVIGHTGGDPISYKKLIAGNGIWAVQKEILGWIFDGIARTLELPLGNITSISTKIADILKHEHASIGTMRLILGKLQHTALAIPVGQSILSPLHHL